MVYANKRENMPFWTKIYAIFWDHHRARYPDKIQKYGTYTKWYNAALRRTHSVMVPRFGFFFQDSQIRVKAFDLKALQGWDVLCSRTCSAHLHDCSSIEKKLSASLTTMLRSKSGGRISSSRTTSARTMLPSQIDGQTSKCRNIILWRRFCDAFL